MAGLPSQGPLSRPTTNEERACLNLPTRIWRRRLLRIRFFFLKIRERKDRLLSKPLRGEAAAAAGLWKEGDEGWRVHAARVANLRTRPLLLAKSPRITRVFVQNFHRHYN